MIRTRRIRSDIFAFSRRTGPASQQTTASRELANASGELWPPVGSSGRTQPIRKLDEHAKSTAQFAKTRIFAVTARGFQLAINCVVMPIF
jgi:hypothetical protein